MKQFTEAIKLKDGRFYNLEYHQERIEQTAHNFYKTRINLSDICNNIPREFQLGLFKCRIVYSNQINSIEFAPYSFRTIQTIKLIYDDEIDYQYKYLDRIHLNTLLQQSACDDIIIVKNGFVTDSYSANLVFESKEGFFTPKSYLLRGTKRQYLLDKGIINDREIRTNDIHRYSKVYFINAMIDLEDNICIDTKSIL